MNVIKKFFENRKKRLADQKGVEDIRQKLADYSGSEKRASFGLQSELSEQDALKSFQPKQSVTETVCNRK